MSGFLNAEFTNDSPSLRNIDVFWFYIYERIDARAYDGRNRYGISVKRSLRGDHFCHRHRVKEITLNPWQRKREPHPLIHDRRTN
jgi:hypothetical protein